jgi:serine/threonine-protein kinase HipA
MVDVAEIWIWGRMAGAVRWDERESLAYFQYDKSFVSVGWELSPIKIPLNQEDRIYRFPELRQVREEPYATFKGLPGLLADSLPDRYGNQLMNIWLAQNGRPADSMNPVEQLCFMGTRGMGALEFKPSYLTGRQQAFSIEMASLVETARTMLANRENFEARLDAEAQKTVNEILKIGTSAGGARPKAVIAYHPDTGELRSGQVKAPAGFEHWMIKLDGVSGAQFGESHGYGRVEYAYHMMALDCGVEMMPCRLLEENGRAHFMTKRFDREGSDIKHHVQTLCGLQHFDYNNMFAYSYEQLFQTMRVLKLTYPEAEQMFKRMVFNVLSSNCDDHTKNFAFRLKRQGRWELAPAYDLCYAYDPSNVWVNQQSLSIKGKNRNIDDDDFMEIAKANSIKYAAKTIVHIRTVIRNWKAYAEKAGVSELLYTLIDRHLIANR